MIDGGLGSEHIGKFQKHPAGIGIDLDITQEFRFGVFGLEVHHEGFDLFGFVLDLCQFFRFGYDWGRRGCPFPVCRLRRLRADWLQGEGERHGREDEGG